MICSMGVLLVLEKGLVLLASDGWLVSGFPGINGL
jgi:hypothetical protein